jgi:hypothetical protein
VKKVLVLIADVPDGQDDDVQRTLEAAAEFVRKDMTLSGYNPQSGIVTAEYVAWLPIWGIELGPDLKEAVEYRRENDVTPDETFRLNFHDVKG